MEHSIGLYYLYGVKHTHTHTHTLDKLTVPNQPLWNEGWILLPNGKERYIHRSDTQRIDSTSTSAILSGGIGRLITAGVNTKE